MPGPFTESLVERGFLGLRRERRFRATRGGGGSGVLAWERMHFFPPGEGVREERAHEARNPRVGGSAGSGPEQGG